MSGFKPIELAAFYRSLHHRGMTTTILAAQLGVSGGAVRRLIGSMRARRGLIWRGLNELLTERERALLATVEQSATWNKRQAAKRPGWNRDKAKLFS